MIHIFIAMTLISHSSVFGYGGLSLKTYELHKFKTLEQCLDFVYDLKLKDKDIVVAYCVEAVK